MYEETNAIGGGKRGILGCIASGGPWSLPISMEVKRYGMIR